VSSLVSPGFRARVRGLAEPIASVFGRIGLTPNHLTVIGFLVACVAAVVAAAGGWLVAGLLVLLGAVFDLFDGALARATGTSSRFGAFMDSTFDRWGEGVVYVGIVWGCLAADFRFGAVLAAAAMTSAFMVSYTRAKSESLGFTPGSGMASVGLAPREVRIALLAAGLIGTGIAGGFQRACEFAFYDDFAFGYPPCFAEGHGGPEILAAALGLIVVLATITTLQRILHVRAQAKEG